MSTELYDYYLRILKLPRSAAEQDIRNAINGEMRVWTRRVNAPTLEARQEAERQTQTLESAEKILLGPEGQIIRSQLRNLPREEIQVDTSIDAETVANAIERIAVSRGMKAQERRGTVLHRRAKIFNAGVNYIFEELVHKKYESFRDRKRCCATKGELLLFEWSHEANSHYSQGKAKVYIHGKWVIDLIAFLAEQEIG